MLRHGHRLAKVVNKLSVDREFSLHRKFRLHELGELLTRSSFVLFSFGNHFDGEFPIADVNTCPSSPFTLTTKSTESFSQLVSTARTTRDTLAFERVESSLILPSRSRDSTSAVLHANLADWRAHRDLSSFLVV